MAVVISFFNYKGGVGKTTTIYNLSYELADQGQKVLVIDADPKMNLTACMYGIYAKTNYREDKQPVLFEDDVVEYEDDFESEANNLLSKKYN